MGKPHHNRTKEYQDLSKQFSTTNISKKSLTGTVELDHKMKTFNLSTLAFASLAVVIAAYQTDALECPADLGEWTEWGPCSESCGLGFRQRYCKEESSPGEFNPIIYTKDTEKCQVQSSECETMEEMVRDIIGISTRLQKWLQNIHRDETKSGYWTFSRVEG